MANKGNRKGHGLSGKGISQQKSFASHVNFTNEGNELHISYDDLISLRNDENVRVGATIGIKDIIMVLDNPTHHNISMAISQANYYYPHLAKTKKMKDLNSAYQQYVEVSKKHSIGKVTKRDFDNELKNVIAKLKLI